MTRSRAARLCASRAPANAELNVMPLAPAEPSPYLYATSTPDTSAFTYDKIMAATIDERARWRCRRKGCRDYEVSVRAGSFFAKSKLPLTKCLRLLLFWCSYLPVGIAQQWLDISAVATIDWYNFCRNICYKEMLTCNMQIGGPGHIVEIDETSLKKKSKYGRGLQHPDNWLFGGIDRTTNLWFGILTGADRKKKTLSPILRKHVKVKTTIISDAFASYVSVNDNHTLENNRFLRGMDYTHRWANHEECFVDPVTGAHTNRIEGAWEVRIKRHLKRMRGVRWRAETKAQYANSMSTTAKELPRGWKEVQSKSRPGKVYFLHVKSGEKTWKLSHVHAKEREFRHRAVDKKKRRSADGSSGSESVQALHILVKHSGSRRPSSWRQETITRSKAVAEAKAGGIREKLLACVEANPDRSSEALRELFEEIAKEESDCSSAKRGGDLGPFTRGKMTPSFEKAAFALKVGEMSELVESDSGVHVILRIA
ncbi:hypothetical protein PF008_g150 [Phytophthora fragariae]|uniref:peptidylprolyl isomerase n=1 Tax=Phytophthora fragariae TaxID=53985 RepID=A0A6G0SP43_9STRA|nr:hypothetical protein PF008_g150 [Phytophthora fragariae]